MADFELLAPGGHQKLVDEVVDRLDLKADIDGYYAQLTAGAADNLTGRGDATIAEFLYRTAGGTADIETGQAVAKSIKGNTLVWNQLVDTPYVSTSGETSGITFTVIDGKRVTAVGTSTAGTNFYFSTDATSKMTAVNGHKYLVRGITKFVTDGLARLAIYYGGAVQHSLTQDSIITATASGIARCYLNIGEAGVTVDADVTPQLFDLTAMFGAGNEPSTVAEFDALFPEPYYEYDAGSLLSVNMTGIDTTGFNQWDEEWENKGIDPSNGAIITDNTKIVSKNLIPVFPSTMYYCKSPNVATYAFWYDANGDYLGFLVTSIQNATFQTPANCHYMRVRVGDSTHPATTYNNDICINLSWSGRRNGEYEPFWSSQREIAASTYFPDGMRSAGTVRDELTSTEAITRVGEVTISATGGAAGISPMSTENANLKAFIVDPTAWNRMTDGAPKPRYGVTTSVTCDKLPTKGGYTHWTEPNIQLWVDTSAPIILAVAEGVTTAAELDTWLASNPLTIHYALRDADVVVTPIEPPLNLSYRVDDFGTERVMVPEDKRSAPPVLDIAYGLNVVDFVRRAPSEYISHASMSQFRLALMAHLGVFINETWDEVDNRYEYTITSE